jgi:XTP/dITP diphosphohydrolase
MIKMIWFATGNEHKRGELAEILKGAGHNCVVKMPKDAGLDFDPDENADTFLGNALIKAHALYELTGGPVIADDSGLCVDALDGRPGIFSARYGVESGKMADSGERNALLLREIGNNPLRSARFVCAMVLLLDKNRLFTAQETLEGEIIREARGGGGFGYDPILFIPAEGRTVAELPADKKNLISHRGKAARAITRFLGATGPSHPCLHFDMGDSGKKAFGDCVPLALHAERNS